MPFISLQGTSAKLNTRLRGLLIEGSPVGGTHVIARSQIGNASQLKLREQRISSAKQQFTEFE